VQVTLRCQENNCVSKFLERPHRRTSWLVGVHGSSQRWVSQIEVVFANNNTNMKVVALFLSVCVATARVTYGNGKKYVCPARSDPCMDDKNFARCQRLAKNGCLQINVLESCPLQFSCAKRAPTIRAPTRTAPAAPTRPAVSPVYSPKTRTATIVRAPPTRKIPDPCPPLTDQCMTDDLFKQCQGLVQQGCTSVIAALSCPYAGFGCAHELPVVQQPSP
jgi:hypothetical protein